MAGRQPLLPLGRRGGNALWQQRLTGATSLSVVSTTARRQHTVVEVWTGDRFELWFDGALLETKSNPYGFVPFVIYPNLREPKKFWGVSDVQAIRESVVELNRALSQLSMILELSGNPENTDYSYSRAQRDVWQNTEPTD